MKNLIKSMLLVVLMAVMFTEAKAIARVPNPIVYNPLKVDNDSMRLLQIEKRVLQIQQMDLSNLSPTEKKNLRKELKGMEQEARSYTGIYVSVGALIIIILLLILILR